MQVPRSVCGLVVIPLIWLYTGFTGWQASAIRSTVMMTIIIAGWSLKRPSDLLNSLAAAAFIILIWDPQQIFQASFQLSFFVVLSLALFTPIFEKLIRRCFQPDPLLPVELRPRWQRRLATPLRWLAASLATSLAAWVGSIPLIAYYFNLFTPVSLIANLIVVPLSSAALAANLASLAVGAWFPAAAGLFNHSAWLWMLLMARVSQWCAEVPGGVFYVPTPSTLSFVFYYAALISLTAGWLTKPGVRRWALAGLAVLGIAWVVHWQATRVGARLTVIPLGGGHAVYCDATGQDGELLVNCGSQFAAEFTLKPFLKSHGVNRLENLLLTHGDVRQIGGSELIDARFPARRILVGPQRFRSPTYRDLVAKSRASPGRWRNIGRGDAIGPWRVLHPDASDRFPQADDGSLVLLGEIEGHRILLLSDLGRPGQNALLARCPDLRAEIVITGLPVRGEPVNDDLLRTVRPSLVIVADSEFPATRRAPPALRERLAARGAATFYTQDCGAMEIAFRAGRCELRAQNQRLWQSPSVRPSVGR
jgi:ComEC/Rec2-related protein